MSEKLDQQSTRAEGDAVRSANLSQAERESNDAKVSTFSVRFQGGDDVDIGSGMLSVMEVPSSTSGLLAKRSRWLATLDHLSKRPKLPFDLDRRPATPYPAKQPQGLLDHALDTDNSSGNCAEAEPKLAIRPRSPDHADLDGSINSLVSMLKEDLTAISQGAAHQVEEGSLEGLQELTSRSRRAVQLCTSLEEALASIVALADTIRQLAR